MKLSIQEILNKNQPIILEGDLSYKNKDYAHVFSLNEIKNVHAYIVVSNFHSIIEVQFKIKANLILQCSYTLEDVDYPMNFTDTIDFSNDIEDENILPLPNDYLDIDQYVLSLIVARIPLRVKKKGAKLPQIDGVRVLSEDEFQKEQEARLDPRLAKLDDWEE